VPTVFRLSRYGVAAATALTVLSMALYPGGTLLDPATAGYSFVNNSISDLGGTVGWNGQPNLAWPVQAAASVIFIIAGVGFFLAVVRVYSASTITTRLARMAGVVVLVAGAGLIASSLTPHDRHAVLHGRFSMVAVWAFPVATALLCAATALDHRLRRRVPAGWLAMTVIVLVWASRMLGPRPATAIELAIPVTLQKMVAGALVATVFFQSYEAERVGRAEPPVHAAV
jgi:hypothetical protein